MPLFSPIFNETAVFDYKVISRCVATPWQLFKARLFGKRIQCADEGVTVKAYRHKGIVYISSHGRVETR